MSDLEFAINEIRENVPEYETAEDYFYGRQAEVFASEAIRKKISQSAQGFRVNFARKPVTSRLARVKIASMSVVPEGDNEAAVKAAKDLTDIFTNEIWEPNQMDLEVPIAHRGALVCGDAYVLVWEADSDDPAVDIFIESAKTMRVFYSEEDERTPIFAGKMWVEEDRRAEDDKRLRVTLYYDDRIEEYRSVRGVDPNKACKDIEFERYAETTEDEEADEKTPLDEPTASELMKTPGRYAGPTQLQRSDNDSNEDAEGGSAVAGAEWPIDNPYGIIPVFHLRTDRPYGRPVHADAYGPQNAITKIAATQMSSTESHGYGQRYALMEGITDDLSDTPDWDDNAAEDGNDPAPEGSLASRIEGGPGTIAALHGVKSVGEFPSSPSSNFIDPMEWWIKAMSTTTDTPLQYVDPSGQLPSGISQAEAKSPLYEDCRHICKLFTPPWRDLGEFAMKILGHDNVKIQVRWAPVNTVSDKDGWDTVVAEQAAGVPRREALIAAGFDAEQVDGWMKTMEASDLSGRVALLGQISSALAQLGAAAQYGVVDAAEVNSFAKTLLKLDQPEEAKP
jgi:hypothetical protein